MKSSEQSNQAKCHPINWVLPLFAYGYVSVLFVLDFFVDHDGFDSYYLFVYSAPLLLFLFPVYIVALVWLSKRRLTPGTKN